MDTHQMQVLSNGKLLRTLPVTTGEEPKFTTRSGIKVIMEKFDAKRMNSETVGIPADSADGYDIDNVQWAMRVTYSGEFIHAAPWSVGSQGNANVSHGCTGMSTANADWLYHMSRARRRRRVRRHRPPDEPGNGYGDWNLSWADYQQGSALCLTHAEQLADPRHDLGAVELDRGHQVLVGQRAVAVLEVEPGQCRARSMVRAIRRATLSGEPTISAAVCRLGVVLLTRGRRPAPSRPIRSRIAR